MADFGCSETVAPLDQAVMRIILFLLAIVIMPLSVQAQYGYGNGRTPARSAGVAVSMMDFSVQPDQGADLSFSFTEPAFGLFYSRQGLVVRLVRGTSLQADGEKLVLQDVAFAVWGSFRPFDVLREGPIDLYFPVGLDSDYRKMSKRGGEVDADVFEVTVMALAAGAGLALPVGESDLSMRATPFFGIASRSFGGDVGSSAGWTTTIEWALEEVRGRLGIYASWEYRWQQWILNADSVFFESDVDNVEYRSMAHSFHVGLTF